MIREAVINFIKLLPVIVSLLLMAAHFYRAGLLPVTAIVLVVTCMLFVPHGWVVRIIQALLAAGSIEWFITLSKLVSMRQAMNMPWIRLVLILGSVSIFTFGSIFMFRMKSLRTRYRLDVSNEIKKDQSWSYSGIDCAPVKTYVLFIFVIPSSRWKKSV